MLLNFVYHYISRIKIQAWKPSSFGGFSLSRNVNVRFCSDEIKEKGNTESAVIGFDPLVNHNMRHRIFFA